VARAADVKEGFDRQYRINRDVTNPALLPGLLQVLGATLAKR
jgi:hypothetical protein